MGGSVLSALLFVANLSAQRSAAPAPKDAPLRVDIDLMRQRSCISDKESDQEMLYLRATYTNVSARPLTVFLGTGWIATYYFANSAADLASGKYTSSPDFEVFDAPNLRSATPVLLGPGQRASDEIAKGIFVFRGTRSPPAYMLKTGRFVIKFAVMMPIADGDLVRQGPDEWQAKSRVVNSPSPSVIPLTIPANQPGLMDCGLIR